MNQKHFSPSRIALAVLLAAAPMGAWAATAPSLGTAASFAALSGTGLTCTGAALDGDVGSLASVTGFPGFPAVLCTTTGTVHAADATALAAHTDLFGANGTDVNLAAQACDVWHGATEQLGGQTLGSGVHCFPSDALLNGTLNLTGSGPWIFRMGSTLTTGATAPVLAQVLVNGQADCGTGVFWQIGSSATIGANTAMVGNILAYASVSFTGANKSLVGGAFANTAAVTIDGTNTSITTCGGTLPPPPPPPCNTHNCDGDDGHDNGHHNGHDKDHKKCNQGVGNGPEGCDPGNSNNNPFGSNDEDGGTWGHPGRKGGNDDDKWYGSHNNPFGSNDKHDSKNGRK